MNVTRPKCVKCGKTAYPMESTTIDMDLFHVSCLRCEQCNTKVTGGNYAGIDGRIFCKTHFHELFMRRGKYSDLASPAGSPQAGVNRKKPKVVDTVAAETPAATEPEAAPVETLPEVQVTDDEVAQETGAAAVTDVEASAQDGAEAEANETEETAAELEVEASNEIEESAQVEEASEDAIAVETVVQAEEGAAAEASDEEDSPLAFAGEDW